MTAGGLSLINAFGEFYAEVVLLKRAVTQSSLPSSARTPGALTPDAVRQRLVDIFEAQAVSVGKNFADHEVRVFEEAQYLMVAMADEVFLRLSWSGRQEWATKPLEAHIFRTHDAGERFFNRLDDIFERRATASTELLTVYLTALALGFQGKFAALGQKGEPEAYRKRLAAYVHRADAVGMAAETRGLCPEAVAHTITEKDRVRLPSIMKGLYALLIVFLGWIVIGQIFWYYRTRDVSEKLDEIDELREAD
jgi:type VI secretion system protein ImpK